MMNESKVKEISSLPAEVLPSIFQYLPIQDVKSCRLVSQLWYCCCGDSLISDKEKFYFHKKPIPNFINKINSILSKCKHTRLNLELECITLGDLNWEKFGHKVRWLKITGNTLDNVVAIERVFTTTPNVQYIRFHSTLFTEPFYTTLWDPIFQSLKEREFENRNLRTFEYYTPCSILNESSEFTYFLQRLSDIFPCMYNVCFSGKFCFTSSNFKEINRIELTSGLYRMSQFVMNRHSFSSFDSDKWKLLPKFKNLRLEISCSTNDVNDVNFSNKCCNFFSKQTELEILSIRLHGVMAENRIYFENRIKFHKNLLFHILRSCRSLKHFHYHGEYHHKIHLNASESLEYFNLIQNIRELKMYYGIIFDFDPSQAPRSANMNTFVKLKTLILDIQNFPSFAAYSELCNLKSLSVIFLNERFNYCEQTTLIVSEILRSQKHLRALRLEIITNFEGKNLLDGGNEEAPSANGIRHERLEHLNLILNFNVFNLRLLDMEFPNLLTFSLEYRYVLWHFSDRSKNLLEWLSRFPYLEKIELGSPIYMENLEECVQFCSRMKRLRYICCSIKEPICDEDMFYLFKSCQSLQNVEIFVGALEMDVYFYSKCDNQLMVKRSDCSQYRYVAV